MFGCFNVNAVLTACSIQGHVNTYECIMTLTMAAVLLSLVYIKAWSLFLLPVYQK